VHSGADEHLADLKRALANMKRLQVLEAIENLAKTLKDTAAEEDAAQEEYKRKRVSSKVQVARGLKLLVYAALSYYCMRPKGGECVVALSYQCMKH